MLNQLSIAGYNETSQHVLLSGQEMNLHAVAAYAEIESDLRCGRLAAGGPNATIISKFYGANGFIAFTCSGNV